MGTIIDLSTGAIIELSIGVITEVFIGRLKQKQHLLQHFLNK